MINGDGTDKALLDSENLSEMDTFIALTGRDEESHICNAGKAKRGKKGYCKNYKN